MIGRANTGGGGTGATLTVTALVGVTVTVSKDGKTKTKVANPSGQAVFKGLATGTWTLTITDGVQTATKAVEITADYSEAIAFFAATINVTYPAGSACTATDGTTTLNAPDKSGTWECVVPNTGTWTISAADGSSTSSKDVSITTDGQTESVSLSYIYWIFDRGNTVDYTGGWTGTGTSSGSLSVANGGGGPAWIAGKNLCSNVAIDISKYSTMHIVVGSYDDGGTVGIGTTNENGSYDKSVSITPANEYTIDVTDISGEYYVKLASTGKQNNSNHYVSIGFSVSKIWLE